MACCVHPDAVILFGSRARGDFTPDSDFDLALVAPDGTERRRLAMQAYESIAAVGGRSVGVDLVVLTPQIIVAERGSGFDTRLRLPPRARRQRAQAVTG